MKQFSIFFFQAISTRSSIVPDMMQLECDEVIQNWDNVERYPPGFGNLKAEATSRPGSRPGSRPKSPKGVLVLDQPQMYDVPPADQSFYDDTPPNSPTLGDGPNKNNLLRANNEYVIQLLHLWRESAEYMYDSAESTQVNLDEYEFSQQWSIPSTDDGATSSQGSDGSHGNSRGSDDDISMEDGSSSPRRTPSPQESLVESTFRNISFLGASSRSNSPLNLLAQGPYDHLRSVSPAILRSPSPVHPVHRLLRSPSPNWEELQASLSELTQQDLLLLQDDRFSTRSRSPASVSDQEVPDIDMEAQSFYSDSDDYSLARARTAQSCQDQVVPEYIEE